jgi:toxin FitB
MLLDSNIVIYAAQPEHGHIRRLIAERLPMVSSISYVEVFGYHRLSELERRFFGVFFSEARVLPLTQPVLDQAVRLRQRRKVKLGDAIIAGTALVHGLPLLTRNSDDFSWISGLTVVNPFQGA